MNKKVAILLVIFNEERHIERLARSIISQSYKEITTYAIDNNSSDSSLSLLQMHLPEANIIHSDDNIGYARGNNVVASKAMSNNADLLFILNTDMELEYDCVRNLVDIINQTDDIAGAGPIVYFGNGERRTENIQCYAINANFRNGRTKVLYPAPNQTYEELPDRLYVNSMHGGCFMVRSSTVSEIGLFNEDNFMYNDEIDLAYRLSKINGKLMVTKEAQVWHYHDWTKKNKYGYYFQYYYINRNRFLFFYRYNKYSSFLMEILAEILQFPLKVRWARRIADLKLLKYYYLGYWHGILNKKGRADIEFK